MKVGRSVARRLQKLELAIVVPSAEAELLMIRVEATGKLDHHDRKLIAHMARNYATGLQVENTLASDAVMARWRDATTELISKSARDRM